MEPHSDQQKDILHDVETVQAKWAKEQARRRAIAIRAILLLIAVVIAVFVTVNVIQKKKAHQEAWEKSISMQLGEDKVFVPLGYPEAKVKITAHLLIPRQDRYLEVLHNAVDSKPSEFFIDLHDVKKTTDEELMKLFGNTKAGIIINGKTSFTIKDDMDRDIVVRTAGDYQCSPDDLAKILNNVHRENYGTSYYLPVLTTEMRDAESSLGRQITTEEVEKAQPPPEPSPFDPVPKTLDTTDLDIRMPALKIQD